jgi:hypothetical protein
MWTRITLIFPLSLFALFSEASLKIRMGVCKSVVGIWDWDNNDVNGRVDSFIVEESKPFEIRFSH